MIDPFDKSGCRIRARSKTVLANQLDEAHTDAARHPGPTFAGKCLEHVIYIVKENRTYDQVLGDLGNGNGDPSLTLFGEEISPNHHKLAREFVLLDNFYVNADVSADGHNWSTAAIAPDYVQKMWPNSYAGAAQALRLRRRRAGRAAACGLHLDQRVAAGLIACATTAGGPTTSPPAAGRGSADRGGARPVARAGHQHGVPRLRPRLSGHRPHAGIPGGTRPVRSRRQDAALHHSCASATITRRERRRARSPPAAVADNDAALGTVVEGLEHEPSSGRRRQSSCWRTTRRTGRITSIRTARRPSSSRPTRRRGAIDSTMYNTTSMLRTMELILGLQSDDALRCGARPMYAAFTRRRT